MTEPHANQTLLRAAALVTLAVAGLGVLGCDDSLEGPSHPSVLGDDAGTDGAAESGAEASVDSGLDGGTD